MLAPEELHDGRSLRQRELAVAEDGAEKRGRADAVLHDGCHVACKHGSARTNSA
jgi:hypothetical protein